MLGKYITEVFTSPQNRARYEALGDMHVATITTRTFALNKVKIQFPGSSEKYYISCGAANIGASKHYSFVNLRDGCIVLVCAMIVFSTAESTECTERKESIAFFGIELKEDPSASLVILSHTQDVDHLPPFKVYSWRQNDEGFFWRRMFSVGDILGIADMKPLHDKTSSPDPCHPNVERDKFFHVGAFMDRISSDEISSILSGSDSEDAFDFILRNQSVGKCLTSDKFTLDDDDDNDFDDQFCY